MIFIRVYSTCIAQTVVLLEPQFHKPCFKLATFNAQFPLTVLNAYHLLHFKILIYAVYFSTIIILWCFINLFYLKKTIFEIQKSETYDNIESHDVVWKKCLTRVDTLKQENAADRVIHINRGRFNKQVSLTCNQTVHICSREWIAHSRVLASVSIYDSNYGYASRTNSNT